MIKFEKITEKNYESTINIKVTQKQKKVIATVSESLADAYAIKQLKPFLITFNNQPVGFILFYIDKKEEFYEICRIMIDKRHQNKGYGRLAMVKAIKYLKNKGAKVITLSHQVDNPYPSHLYLSLGFKYTGVIEDGIEKMMELKL